MKKPNKFRRFLLFLVAWLRNPLHKGGFKLLQGYDPIRKVHRHVAVKKELQ